MASSKVAPVVARKTRHGPPDVEGGPHTTRRSDADADGSPGEAPESTCLNCGLPADYLVHAYWGADLCPACCAIEAAEREEGGWPMGWWEVKAPPHVIVWGSEGFWRCNEPIRGLGRPRSIAQLGEMVTSMGVTQVWVHRSGLELLGFPAEIHISERNAGWVHPFTEDRGDWQSGRSPGLKHWSYWWRKGGDGFDLHIPAYGGRTWADVESAPELLARVAQFDHATRGVVWKGNGTITSDVFLRGRLRKQLAPTELPPPALEGKVRELAKMWHRRPTDQERNYRYVHSLDLNLAYAAGASSVPLPTGGFIHLEDWPAFDPKVAGIYAVEHTVEMTTTLRWVTAPTMQRLDAQGVHAFEAYVWPKSGRHLRAWYEMIRDARTELVQSGGGEALMAVKSLCREGLGRMASKARTVRPGGRLEDDPMYQPYWAWAVIAEVRERLLARVAELSIEPVAIDTDGLYFLSSRKSPGALGAHLGLPLGDGLGQFKSGGTGSAAAARAALMEERSTEAIKRLQEIVK